MSDSEIIEFFVGLVQSAIIGKLFPRIHRFWKYVIIIAVGFLSGFGLWVGTIGGFDYIQDNLSSASSWMKLFFVCIRITAYSFGSWGAMWKKWIKKPEDQKPIEPPIIQMEENSLQEQVESSIYELSVSVEDENLCEDIPAQNAYNASLDFIEKNKNILEKK